MRTHPDLSLEQEYGSGVIVCGVDEVGRGPLAGPVTAGAVILPALANKAQLGTMLALLLN